MNLSLSLYLPLFLYSPLCRCPHLSFHLLSNSLLVHFFPVYLPSPLLLTWLHLAFYFFLLCFFLLFFSLALTVLFFYSSSSPTFSCCCSSPLGLHPSGCRGLLAADSQPPYFTASQPSSWQHSHRQEIALAVSGISNTGTLRRPGRPRTTSLASSLSLCCQCLYTSLHTSLCLSLSLSDFLSCSLFLFCLYVLIPSLSVSYVFFCLIVSAPCLFTYTHFHHMHLFHLSFVSLCCSLSASSFSPVPPSSVPSSLLFFPSTPPFYSPQGARCGAECVMRGGKTREGRRSQHRR